MSADSRIENKSSVLPNDAFKRNWRSVHTFKITINSETALRANACYILIHGDILDGYLKPYNALRLILK